METLDLSKLPTDVIAAGAEIAEESGLLAVADAALDATGNTSASAEIIGNVVDVLIDFESLELGPLGPFLEEHDGDIAAWMAELVLRLAMDPDRRAKRKARREDRRAKFQGWWSTRKDKRGERKAARQED